MNKFIELTSLGNGIKLLLNVSDIFSVSEYEENHSMLGVVNENQFYLVEESYEMIKSMLVKQDEDTNQDYKRRHLEGIAKTLDRAVYVSSEVNRRVDEILDLEEKYNHEISKVNQLLMINAITEMEIFLKSSGYSDVSAVIKESVGSHKKQLFINAVNRFREGLFQ